MFRVLGVAGARPNFMKIGPVARALEAYDDVEFRLVHTGQHYDERMSKVFFEELALPRPHTDLGVGSGTHSEQTAGVMLAFEPLCVEWKPHMIVVVGDVNSTVACALVGAKLGIPVAHVESGLRSFDLSMPEEINRMVTDRLSRLLLTTEASANENLAREGVPDDHVHFVGNVMIDTLLAFRERAMGRAPWTPYGVGRKEYVLVTLHRPSNVDDPAMLAELTTTLGALSRKQAVVFPTHPRTRQRLAEFGLLDALESVNVTEPLGYVDFLGLLDGASLVLTDSGGVQEETTVLGVPCLTLRPNTERPVTLEMGTNTLVPPGSGRLDAEIERALQDPVDPGVSPPLWDGHAAERTARVFVDYLRSGTTS